MVDELMIKTKPDEEKREMTDEEKRKAYEQMKEFYLKLEKQVSEIEMLPPSPGSDDGENENRKEVYKYLGELAEYFKGDEDAAREGVSSEEKLAELES